MKKATRRKEHVADGTIAIALLGLVVLSLSFTCAGQNAGQVKFVNSCQYPLTFNSTGPQIGTLQPGGNKSIPLSAFNQGGQNRFIPYPDLADGQCPDCDKWTDLGGPPEPRSARAGCGRETMRSTPPIAIPA